MRKRLIEIGAAGLALAALAGGGAAWATSGGDDSEGSATGPAADRARAAALAHAGGGRATEVERGSEHGAWEVEVVRADGSVLEIVLDESYRVVGAGSDSEDSGSESGQNEDGK